MHRWEAYLQKRSGGPFADFDILGHAAKGKERFRRVSRQAQAEKGRHFRGRGHGGDHGAIADSIGEGAIANEGFRQSGHAQAQNTSGDPVAAPVTGRGESNLLLGDGNSSNGDASRVQLWSALCSFRSTQGGEHGIG